MTELPGIARAVIEESKVREYLLSETHPVGRFKAVFFASLGYSPLEWRALERDLRRHASSHPARVSEGTPFGQKYEVSGTMAGPNGRQANVLAVWIVLADEDFPRLVTAYPD